MSMESTSRVWADDNYAHIKPLPDPPKRPDAMQQRRNIVRADSILDDFFSDSPDVLVSGNGFLCVEYRDGYDRLVPDCLVAFGVDPAAIEFRNGYVIGEVGKPPEFVLEVASGSTGRRDVDVKRGIYAGFGVTEYWRFDRTGGEYHGAPLGADRLLDGVYVPIELNYSPDGVTWGHSPVLGLDLCWDEGRLRFYDPATREYLPELKEAKFQTRDAIFRADAAEAEALRLQEELRRLGAE